MIKSILDKLAQLTAVQLVILAGMSGGFYYYTLFNDGSQLDAQASQLDVEISTQQAKKKETEELLKEESRMKELIVQQTNKYAEIAKRLPSQLTTLQLNESIDNFVKASGVVIKSKRPGNAEKQEIVEEIPIQVTLEGTFSELTAFIYQLSSNERVTTLKTFSMQQSSDSGRATLEGNVVGYKLLAEVKAPAGEVKQ